jgi:hypothetical protein
VDVRGGSEEERKSCDGWEFWRYERAPGYWVLLDTLRRSWGAISEMKALHAGYVSGAVWKAVQDGQLSPDLNWQDVLTQLSHFVIDHDVGGDKTLPPELAVLEKICCRGLSTLPSLFVEQQLQQLARITRPLGTLSFSP